MHKHHNNKLKILWIAYQPLLSILKILEPEQQIVRGGWLDGASDVINKHDDITLSYCFQYNTICEGKTGTVAYYSMPVVPVIHSKEITTYRPKDFNRFRDIIRKVQPDVIHIFGTETWFQRQFVWMIKDMGFMDRTVVWIQGLTSFCANCYTDGLKVKQFKRKTLWEFLRGTNIEGIQKRLELNGRGESQEIRILKNVFVRTEWDSACCRAINPDIKLYRCNETLRPAFYEGTVWDIHKMKRHTIFMSQYAAPLKGFHQALKALPIIINEFPDAVLLTTGRDIFQKSSLEEKIREHSYIKILREEILKNNLQDHVKFLGDLQGEEMRNQYLNSHVFISASVIENSSNSIGEAMMVGVPVTASDVGGTNSMLTHKEEGFLYPFNEYALLAEYICRIFRNDAVAEALSRKARERALNVHNRLKNYEDLLNAYYSIMEGQ